MARRPPSRRAVWILCAALALGAEAARAQAQSNLVKLDVPDVTLVDQDGRSARFRSELIGDRYAAITFVFTRCPTICPMLNGIFKRLQKEIPGRLGDDTVLLTVSVDPVNDIPERLKEHAERLHAEPGWSFLTGELETVNRLLRALEVYTPDYWDHAPTVFVVDGRRDVWTRLYGFPTPERIREVLDGYSEARPSRLKAGS
jgi:protein SCO1/2